MKNIKYSPFERNRYFYGKLLSVEDFETEQRYNNNKRRMSNRFLHGTGVVCGMNVIAVDDSSISIEKGFALDFCGREIVIDVPVMKKLALIDGFDTYNDRDQNNNNLYLCVEYDESEKEPVHSITNSKTNGTDGVEYNKFAEGYHLYLSNEEPQSESFTPDSYYEDKKVIYWGNRIRILQIIPRYIQSNSQFEMKILVENLGQTKPFSFSYDLDLNCIQSVTKGSPRITFDDSKFDKASVYEITYPLKSLAVKDTEGRVSVNENSFSLVIGGKKSKAEAKGSCIARITEGNLIQEVIANYYNTAMEDITKNSFQQGIYLAKILVMKAGTTYLIDSIEPMPFKQYIFSNPLAGIVNSLILNKETNKDLMKVRSSEVTKNITNTSGQENVGLVTAGVAVLDLGIGGSVGQKFFSQEIVHGLGLGAVNIMLGEVAGLGDDSNIIFGSQDIFENKGNTLKAELAARADVLKGTFVIGMKCLENTSLRQVKVQWMACKDNKKKVYEKELKTMNIKPDILNLLVCETYYFEAVISDETESRVIWRVKEEGGGTIDDNGMYTAPNKAGVYELIAESMDNAEIKASAFIVIREK